MGLKISTEYWIFSILFDIWFEIRNISYDYRNSIFDSIFDLKVPFVICFEHFKKVPFVQHCLEMRKLGTVRVRLCVCRSCTLTSSGDDKIVVFNWHFFIRFDYQLVLEVTNHMQCFWQCSLTKNIYLWLSPWLVENPQKRH